MSTRYLIIHLGLVLAAAAALAACDSHRTLEPSGDDDQAQAKAQQPTGRAGESRAEGADEGGQGAGVRPSAAVDRDGRYRTRTYPSSVDVGSTTRVHFDIVAGNGWKANQEFGQWQIELSPTSTLSLSRTQFRNTDVDVTESRARATASVTIPEDARSGQNVRVSATATFSVCTDETCHVLRDRKLTFPLELASASPPPPGGSGPRPYR